MPGRPAMSAWPVRRTSAFAIDAIRRQCARCFEQGLITEREENWRPDSWALVQNSCLQLVETLEQALSSWFEDDDGAVAGLRGEHCKLIRSA
jgi:hypothetical protein